MARWFVRPTRASIRPRYPILGPRVCQGNAPYTPESWKTQVQSQANVSDRIRPMVDALNGKIETIYYAFGEYDLIAIAEFPNDEAAAAFALAATAGGACKTFKTTPLMSVS